MKTKLDSVNSSSSSTDSNDLIEPGSVLLDTQTTNSTIVTTNLKETTNSANSASSSSSSSSSNSDQDDIDEDNSSNKNNNNNKKQQEENNCEFNLPKINLDNKKTEDNDESKQLESLKADLNQNTDSKKFLDKEIKSSLLDRYQHCFRNDSELKAVDDFLKIQNWSSSDAKNWNIAVKFLMARKFDVERAAKLYNEHESLRKKEGLDYINLNDLEFIKELETGKFTILPFVKNFPVCALFTVRLHNSCPNSCSNDLTTLKTLIYQLDAALENPDAQRNGINFIYDMNNCKRANYDLALSQKILTLVRGSYPARLNKLFVVAAPFWFKCFVKVLFVTNEELKNQIPVEILPDYLGGLVKLNHTSWLVECNKLVTSKASTCSLYYYFNSNTTQTNKSTLKETKLSSSMQQQQAEVKKTSSNETSKHAGKEDEFNSNRKRQSSGFIDLDDKKHAKKQINNSSHSTQTVNGGSSTNLKDLIGEKIEPLPFKNFYESIQNLDSNSPKGLSINELVEHVINAGAYGLSDEFKIIRNQPIISCFEAFKDRENLYKNRYRDVICLDESRIKLLECSKQNTNFKNDYIHGNYVDGYKQKNAYISTQGPLDETVEDFWRMIWQEVVLVIAMTTKVIEQRKIKCAQYWPLEKDEIMRIEDLFEIKNISVEDLGDYRVSKLIIRHLPTDQTRQIAHCQFLSWPDHGVPKTAAQILDFIDLVRKNQSECLGLLKTKWTDHPLGPPICVHCSAGIGRTGTFCTIDISINRLNDCKTVNILDTVNKIRLQRAQSVQMRDQYVFCYLAVMEYAQRENLLTEHQSIDLAQLFDSLF